MKTYVALLVEGSFSATYECIVWKRIKSWEIICGVPHWEQEFFLVFQGSGLGKMEDNFTSSADPPSYTTNGSRLYRIVPFCLHTHSVLYASEYKITGIPLTLPGPSTSFILTENILEANKEVESEHLCTV